MINIYIHIHIKYPLFLSDFNETWIFWTVFFFSKNTQISNFMKVRRVGAEFFQANGRTNGQNRRSSQFYERT